MFVNIHKDPANIFLNFPVVRQYKPLGLQSIQTAISPICRFPGAIVPKRSDTFDVERIPHDRNHFTGINDKWCPLQNLLPVRPILVTNILGLNLQTPCPRDGSDVIDKHVELVESGALKEQNGRSVATSQWTVEHGELGWGYEFW